MHTKEGYILFKNILAISCVAVLLGCSENSQVESKLIAENVSLYDPQNVADFISQNKITPAQAMTSLEGLQTAMKNSYIGYELKKNLIGKSGDQIFAECKAALAARTENLSSFELYDYVLQCLSDFKDTHLNLSKSISPSWVTTGISEAKLIGGKLYIARNRPEVLKKFEELKNLSAETLTKALAIGNEITAIDGADPMTEITRLRSFVSASSNIAHENEAVSEIFSRNYSYPTKSSVKLTIKLPDATTTEVEIPWIQYIDSSTQGSIESRTILVNRGIIKGTDLNPDSKFLKSKGLDVEVPLFKNIANLRTFTNEDEDDFLITGGVEVNGKSYCYMKLNSFSPDNDDNIQYKVYEKIEGKTYPLSLTQTLKNFLGSCEAFKAPLIFDLRNNGGGDARLADVIYSYFDNKNVKTTYVGRSPLAEVGNFSYITGKLNKIENGSPAMEDLLILKSLQEAMKLNRPTGDWAATRDLSLTRGLYNQDITVLTSPSCISACDMTASRFKRSGRGRIVGEHTNGTGFGFSSAGRGKTNFRDVLNLFEVEIPNNAFNVIVIEDDTQLEAISNVKGILLPFASVDVIENSPTLVDVEIRYTLKDMTNNFSDYLEKLGTVLTAETQLNAIHALAK